VASSGTGVRDWKVGDRIALAADIRCGQCAYCRRDLPNMCDGLRILGKHVDGGMCDYMLLTRDILERGIINRVPASLSTLHAALSEPLCSVLASHDELAIEPGETVAILGCGPMGILHLELVRARGARGIPVDTAASRIEMVRRDFGAEDVVDATRLDPVDRVRELTQGLGADVVITAAPSAAAVAQSVRIARKRGRIGVFGGLPADQAMVALDMNRVHYGEIRLVGNFSYHPRYHARALEMLARGAVSCDKLITTYRLEDTERGLRDIREGKVLKAIVLPNEGTLL
jgi:L-iditol 2-dehydrogenase